MSGRPPTFTRAVHLLYVPTLACNLDCSYCYLGAQTTTAALRVDAGRAVSTLRTALADFEADGVLAFNVSLHGGEVTTLPPAVLGDLFDLIRGHYLRHFDAITSLGHRKAAPHVKTNLYRFDAFHDLFTRRKVSVSASIDLPLALHDRHRRTRGGGSWRSRMEGNLRLLAAYPHPKKISATLSAVHLTDPAALIKDIWHLHRELGFDMTNFNLMFAFPSALNAAHHGPATLEAGTPQHYLGLYEALHQEFVGTELEEGLRRHWFEEFTPSYCTNSVNCGERFFLLQSDGTVYSCVRGQGLPEFRYGNIFEDSVETILAAGAARIATVHVEHGFDSACRACPHLPHCHTGCPVVKHQRRSGRSYTCEVQQAIYRDNPLTYPAATAEEQRTYSWEYLAQVHPGLAATEPPPPRAASLVLPDELGEDRNRLRALIEADPVLTQLYRSDAWVLEVDGEFVPLVSQILREEVSHHTLLPGDRLRLHLRRELLEVACPEPVRNTVHLQVLRDTPVVYGDERRPKQEHLFTYELFTRCLEDSPLGPEWGLAELTEVIHAHRNLYRRGVRNNLFATTGHLRDYHYRKQRENAFYHIQAINLPFQNLEFNYLPGG